MTTVRRVNFNTFDVFFGTQWDQWARVKVGRSSIQQMAGDKMSFPVLKSLRPLLHPLMPINYGQSQETTLTNCKAI